MSLIRRLILYSNQSFPSVTARRTRLVLQAWKHSQRYVCCFSVKMTSKRKVKNILGSSCRSFVISHIFLLIVVSLSLGDETCDFNSETCTDSRVPNHKDFYRSPLSGQNINSKVTLNDGVVIPMYGLGVYQAGPGEETRSVVLWALEKGYRQIDTASRYKNEDSVGEALREANLTRDEVFVVTKLYDDDHGYEETLTAFSKSLERLGLEFVDLYLIHSPLPDRVVPSWNAMIKLRQQGLIRSIGVSNFGIHHLEALKQHSTVKPAVNQIEVHPFLQERELVQYCEKEGIVVQAYSPLTRGEKLNHPTLKAVGNAYNKTPAQILLRWCIQKGFVCIPKSSHSSRIKENAEIFDFAISKEDMDILDGLDEGFRTGRPKILQPWKG